MSCSFICANSQNLLLRFDFLSLETIHLTDNPNDIPSRLEGGRKMYNNAHFCLFLAIFSLCSTLALTSCEFDSARTSGKTLEPVTLQLKWVHQAQFAGFYLARKLGYYESEGLKVTFLEGGTNIDQVEQLKSNKADFALVPAESLFLKNSDFQMQAIAVIYQQSPLIFVSKKDSGITKPEHFLDKTVAVGSLDGGFLEGIIQFNALAKARNIDTSSITTVPYDWSFKGLIEGSVDISPTYLTSGFIKLKHMGVDTEVIWPGDYGLNYYADTLVTQCSMITEHPDTVLRFLRASLKGWQEAVSNHEEALAATIEQVKEVNKAKEADMLDSQQPLIDTGVNPIGWMEKKRWRIMHDLLIEQGVLEKQMDIDRIYTTEFLVNIYAGQ